jgi:GNAT superfamily N-acetyltransferase
LSVSIRRLRREELAKAPDLLRPEGWGFELHELERLARLGGAVGGFDGTGRLVAFLSFVDLPPIRWIGNVVVDGSLRGQGVGARLVEEALRDAPRAGLYAVEKAVTLYERLGFVAWGGDAWAHRAGEARPLRPSVVQRMTRDDLLEVSRLDRRASGMDRGFLLRELLKAYPDSACIARSGNHVIGFGFAKTSPDLTELGPVVATTPRAAEDLIDALLAATPGPHEATALSANPKALEALRERGFAPAFRTVVMFRGAPPEWRPQQLVVAAGLEKG